MRGTPQARAAWIRVAYFGIFPTGILALFLGFYPHLFFTSGGELFDSVSYFGFLGNLRETCLSALDGTASVSPEAVRFSYIMIIFWGLTCFLMVWYVLFLLSTALLASVALTPRAASPLLNRCKRLYRILVPARGFFVFLSLVPALLSCLPWLFTVFYRSVLNQSAVLHYDLLPDVVPLALLSVPVAALFLLTLPAQRDLKLDLFRIYKVGK